MPQTNKQSSKEKLWNAITKLKYLSQVSKSFGVIIPQNFLTTLGINRDTLLIMTINTIDETIMIKKVKNPEQYAIKSRKVKNEEVDYTISE